MLFGWVMPSLVYLVLLLLIGLQWRFNQGCCVINNFESWLRTGHWRDPDSKEEGTFLLMLCEWLGRVRPEPKVLDRTSYGTLTVLWLFGFGRFMWLAAA